MTCCPRCLLEGCLEWNSPRTTLRFCLGDLVGAHQDRTMEQAKDVTEWIANTEWPSCLPSLFLFSSAGISLYPAGFPTRAVFDYHRWYVGKRQQQLQLQQLQYWWGFQFKCFWKLQHETTSKTLNKNLEWSASSEQRGNGLIGEWYRMSPRRSRMRQNWENKEF